MHVMSGGLHAAVVAKWWKLENCNGLPSLYKLAIKHN